MRRLKLTLAFTLSVLLATSALPALAQAEDLLILEIELPPQQALGKYSGAARVALGAVTDAVVAEHPRLVGLGPQGNYLIWLPKSREESARDAMKDLLEKTGLAPSGDLQAQVQMEVTLRRDRFFIDQTAGRFRIRSEVFFECTFRKEGAVVGRLLACGNAQTHAQLATKKKVGAVYEAALWDALYKLVQSKTFLAVVGEGWTPGSAAPPESNYEMTRVVREKFYGPSDFIRAQLAPVQKALAGRRDRRILLPDFAMKDPKLEDKKPEQVTFAKGYLPGLVREHLDAFFPGAFEEIQRLPAPPPAEGIAVTGDLLRYKEGNFALRIWVGMGAGKDKLEADVVLRDGATGASLYTMHVLESNWGGGWQTLRGQLRDMADQTGRDLAFLLVTTLVPDYRYPADLEVCFDGQPYPAPPSTRNE